MVPIVYGFSAHWNDHNIRRIHKGQYVLKRDERFFLLEDRCHHRGYHLFNGLQEWDNIDPNRYVCPVHGQKGMIDKLILQELTLDSTGLVTNGWTTDGSQQWVQQVGTGGPYTYHSTARLHNRGDWRYQTEMNVDMYHINYIHPRLSGSVDLDAITYTNNKDHLVQHWCEEGWWCIIYPFYQFEWQPGSVYLAEVIPNGYDSYETVGHFYHTDDGESEVSREFRDLMIHTYREDMQYAGNMGEFYGPYASNHPLEDQVVHWHNYYHANAAEISKLVGPCP